MCVEVHEVLEVADLTTLWRGEEGRREVRGGRREEREGVRKGRGTEEE